MNNWEKVTLGDVCELLYGKSLTANKREKGNIPVYSSAGITGWHNKPLVNNRGIIVGRKGTVGTVYLSEVPFYCIDTAYYILPNDDIYNFKYLYYRLKSLGLNKLNEDSAVPGLNRDNAYSQEFNLPPLDEQKRIADVLSALDDKIEINNKINENLEAQAQAIFKQWFVDFEFPDKEGKPYKSNGGKFIDSELGQIPEGWKVGRLGDIVKVIDNRGKTPPLSEIKTEYPIIDVRALNGSSRFVDYNNCMKFVNNETYNYWFRNGHPKENDILISTVGSLAEMKIFTGNIGAIAQNVVALRPEISTYYLYQYLLNIKSDLLGYDIGSVQPSIKVTHIIKHPILIPSYYCISMFDKIIKGVSNKISNNHKEITCLSEIRDNLLPKLMSGEVRV